MRALPVYLSFLAAAAASAVQVPLDDTLDAGLAPMASLAVEAQQGSSVGWVDSATTRPQFVWQSGSIAGSLDTQTLRITDLSVSDLTVDFSALGSQLAVGPYTAIRTVDPPGFDPPYDIILGDVSATLSYSFHVTAIALGDVAIDPDRLRSYKFDYYEATLNMDLVAFLDGSPVASKTLMDVLIFSGRGFYTCVDTPAPDCQLLDFMQGYAGTNSTRIDLSLSFEEIFGEPAQGNENFTGLRGRFVTPEPGSAALLGLGLAALAARSRGPGGRRAAPR